MLRLTVVTVDGWYTEVVFSIYSSTWGYFEDGVVSFEKQMCMYTVVCIRKSSCTHVYTPSRVLKKMALMVRVYVELYYCTVRVLGTQAFLAGVEVGIYFEVIFTRIIKSGMIVMHSVGLFLI